MLTSKQSWYVREFSRFKTKFTLPENFAAPEKAASSEIGLKWGSAPSINKKFPKTEGKENEEKKTFHT